MTAGYTGDNLRAWKQTSAGVRTYFLYDGASIVCELSSTGAVTATNTWGCNGLLSRRVGTTSSFYTFDLAGNLAQTLNSAGGITLTAAVNAFGQRTASGATSDPYSGFGGQWGCYDDSESGLFLMGARYYDVTTGRFLTRDPLGYTGGINLYAYCGNDPVNYSDPDGDFAQILAGAIIGGGIGFGVNIAVQLAQNGGSVQCIDWKQAGLSAASGAITGAIGGATGGLSLLPSLAVNTVAGAAVGAGQQAVYNEWTGQSLSKGLALNAALGGLGGAAGAVVSSAATATGNQAASNAFDRLTPAAQLLYLGQRQAGNAGYFSDFYNNIVAKGGAAFSNAIGNAISNATPSSSSTCCCSSR